MSRRPPNPAAERAAQNTATIKNLLKLEANKVCADCKRNKHPRWASWNLGVFVCIRCSGIHRGMGTHISRVKSVDLDSWTDEQLQSVLSWGNARANKYWESKLAAGHVPSEAKIENFIRTKYELKRWVMDGERPDPASLDVDGDDDVPLSLVKEKQQVERRESVRKASVGQSAAPRGIQAPPQADLIGGDDIPQRASSAGPVSAQIPPKAAAAPPKPTTTKDSLLGLDFFAEPSAPPRPASTNAAGVGAAPSRPDLKQSILSLYATAPRPQAQQNNQGGSFGGLASPGFGQPQQQQQQQQHQQQSSFGGMNDAFSNLGFGGQPAQKPAAVDPFASFGSPQMGNKSPQMSSNAFGGLGGGSFFDSKPAAPAASSHQKQPSNSGFGGFGWSTSPAAAPSTTSPPPQAKPAQQQSSMGDLFDLSSPAPPPQAAPKVASPPATSSVFNLTQAKPSAPAPAAVSTTSPLAGSNFSGADVWGSNDWASSEPAAAPAPSQPKPAVSSNDDFGGWASSTTPSGGLGGFSANTPIVPGNSGGFNTAPKVSADEEFGGWASSAGPATGGNTSSSNNNGAAKPASGGFGGSDDLFSNVWE
ncbi:hypothetical protein F5X68DRAFT_279728 [Plectosphaerella plurivora]|uniref:Arf-GAP domain-containing protein n=1 Tax=Plectosphaerella plurivora TaxID=936078 RepID=A0A9P8V204_9PEZI|nr:hypothetical protein F5X68DRAFT_279728 [Plectosphaerella plurivora]